MRKLAATFAIIGLFLSFSVKAEKQNASSTQVSKKMELLIKSSGIKKSELGLWVSRGEFVAYENQADKLFIPASLSKIATAVSVLSLIPPGHKFKTSFAVEKSEPSLLSNLKIKDGKIEGSLYLIGGGDPSFTSEKAWFLVNELVRSGVKTIAGDLIVDDSRFDDIRFGEDRQGKRVDRAYDAPLGAMSLNWNAVSFFVRPGTKIGEPANISIDIDSSFIELRNRTKTVKAGAGYNLTIKRLASKQPEKGEIFLATGTVGIGHPEKPVYKSIREPAAYAGTSMLKFLAERGVSIKGQVRQSHQPIASEDLTVIATAESKPIESIVADMGKWSNNFVADMLVKNLAVESGKSQGTVKAGIGEIRKFLENQVGLKRGTYEFINGSGFTRDNKFTPAQLGAVLKFVKKDFQIYPDFLMSIPVAGVDGTLRSRFGRSNGIGRVRAKTGLLNGAVGLAGFAAQEDEDPLAFVFLYNGPAGKEPQARRLFDDMASALTQGN